MFYRFRAVFPPEPQPSPFKREHWFYLGIMVICVSIVLMEDDNC